MKERGIIFSAPMVRAILDRRKTQTRRIMNPQPVWDNGAVGIEDRSGRWIYSSNTEEGFAAGLLRSYVRCPYGAPGDRLWVRETHARFAVGNRSGAASQCVAYRATCDDDGGFDYVHGDEVMRLKVTKWTPARFMPRWASRITLELTAVRVERLQAITEEDARAEGVAADNSPCDHPRHSCADVSCIGPGYRAAFGDLWNEINGRRAPWSSNPWVWVLSFRRVEEASRG